jgi:hypothetical protein
MTTKSLIDAASRLCDILEAENAALEAMDIVTAIALVGEKQSATEALLAGRKLIPSVPEGEWATVGKRLAELAKANKRLLERAMFAQNRVMACIARAIPRALPPQAAYGAKGNVPQRRSLPPMALSNSA